MNKRDQSFRLEGLRYALEMVQGRRILNRPAAYLAALDEMEIFLKPAMARVERGESMYAVNVVEKTSCQAPEKV